MTPSSSPQYSSSRSTASPSGANVMPSCAKKSMVTCGLAYVTIDTELTSGMPRASSEPRVTFTSRRAMRCSISKSTEEEVSHFPILRPATRSLSPSLTKVKEEWAEGSTLFVAGKMARKRCSVVWSFQQMGRGVVLSQVPEAVYSIGSLNHVSYCEPSVAPFPLFTKT